MLLQPPWTQIKVNASHRLFNASVIYQNPKLISSILKGMESVYCDHLKKKIALFEEKKKSENEI